MYIRKKNCSTKSSPLFATLQSYITDSNGLSPFCPVCRSSKRGELSCSLLYVTCTLCWLGSKESLRKIERNAKINVERDEHAEDHTSIDARPLTRGESLHRRPHYSLIYKNCPETIKRIPSLNRSILNQFINNY